MKIYELAKDLGLAPQDVLRTARKLEIKAKTETSDLTASDAKKLRDHIADFGPTRLEPGAESAVVPAVQHILPLPELPPVQLQDLSARPCRGLASASIAMHEDLFAWLADGLQPRQLRKRLQLVLEQIHAHGQPHRVKMTAGANEGWRRTTLGGHGGNHYYLYWAPNGAPPVKHLDLGQGRVLARAVRHHDETDVPLAADGEFVPWSPQDLLDGSERDLPYSELQIAFSANPNAIKVLQGHPGAGKTTTLHLAARRCPAGRLVYVTWSARLASEAREALRATAPADVDCVVLTWQEVLSEITEPSAGPLAPEDAIAEVRAALDQWQTRSPWKDDAAGAYAELYANWTGAALPFEFGRLAATASGLLDPDQFAAWRAGAVGGIAARQIADFAQRLTPTDLDHLCPAPRQAFRALSGLLDGSLRIPPSWSGAQMVLVDEVQDFTLVELACLVELLVVTAKSAEHLPHVVLAGDEGQTVRPTDFDWGRLKQLLKLRLNVDPTSLELPGNVRSPRVIAGIVNRSWSLYGGIAKRERPRGRAEAEIEEVEVGHVLHCVATTDVDFLRLAEGVSKMPGAQWVHPGHHVPASLRESCPDIMTTAEAKGCGFSIVGLVDASQRLRELGSLSQQGQSGDLRSQTNARTLADQLRVALSRSTDTLVLVDRSGNVAEELQKLCAVDGRLDDGVRLNMDVDSLLRELEGLTTSAAARVQAWLTDAAQRLADDPVRALQRAEWACAALGKEGAPGAVADGALRQEVYRFAGVACVLVALQNEGSDATQPLGEAQKWFELAKIQVGKTIATELAKLAKQDSPEAALKLAQVLRVPDAQLVHELARRVEWRLLDWSKRATTRLPANLTAAERIDAALLELLGLVPQRKAELTERRDQFVDLAVARHLDERAGLDALDWLAKRSTRRPQQEAKAQELLEDWRLAADAWEDAGEIQNALRCLRRASPAEINFKRAAELARKCGESSVERAMVVGTRFDELVDELRAIRQLLTVEERECMLAAVDDVLDRGAP